MTTLTKNQEIWVRQEVRPKTNQVLYSELNTESTRNCGALYKVKK